ncbi:MAG: AAA family ATPase [Dehalococcoidia bacterium]|nr:AAA family ATPase [Dehalococcoidia bacterium]
MSPKSRSTSCPRAPPSPAPKSSSCPPWPASASSPRPWSPRATSTTGSSSTARRPLGLLTINALTASDFVMVPVQCEYMALEGLSRLLETLHLVQGNLNTRPATSLASSSPCSMRARAFPSRSSTRSATTSTAPSRPSSPARSGSVKRRATGNPSSATNPAAAPRQPTMTSPPRSWNALE